MLKYPTKGTPSDGGISVLTANKLCAVLVSIFVDLASAFSWSVLSEQQSSALLRYTRFISRSQWAVVVGVYTSRVCVLCCCERGSLQTVPLPQVSSTVHGTAVAGKGERYHTHRRTNTYTYTYMHIDIRRIIIAHRAHPEKFPWASCVCAAALIALCVCSLYGEKEKSSQLFPELCSPSRH